MLHIMESKHNDDDDDDNGIDDDDKSMYSSLWLSTMPWKRMGE